MSSSNSMDLLTSSDKLGECNYHSWAIKMRALLMSKKLWMYVKGIIPKPDSASPLLMDWQSNAYAAAGLIMLNLQDSQLTHISGTEDDPQLIWDTLEAVHIQKRPNSRFMAYSNLLNISKLPEESLPAVTTRIEQAIKDVVALRPKDYDLTKLDDDLACMAMLRCLPPDYSSFVSTISLMDTISMDKLKTAFITEESNRKAFQAHSPVSTINLVSSSSTAKKSNTRKPYFCNWCERTGHTEERCFARRDSQEKDKENAKKSKPSAAANSSQDPPSTDGKTEHASNTSLSLNTACLTLWCADSGASSHMTPHRHWFKHYRPHVIPIELADGNIIHSAGIGSVLFEPVVLGVHRGPVEIRDVLHVPALSKSLLSLTQLTVKDGFKIVMIKNTMQFYLKNKLVCTSAMVGNISCLVGSTISHDLPASALNTTASPLTITLWHRRFSHLNEVDLRRMDSLNLVDNLVIIASAKPDPICEPCIAGNQRRDCEQDSYSPHHSLGSHSC